MGSWLKVNIYVLVQIGSVHLKLISWVSPLAFLLFIVLLSLNRLTQVWMKWNRKVCCNHLQAFSQVRSSLEQSPQSMYNMDFRFSASVVCSMNPLVVRSSICKCRCSQSEVATNCLIECLSKQYGFYMQ